MASNIIYTNMDKAVEDANIVSQYLEDEYLGVYALFLTNRDNLVSHFYRAERETLLHIYIRELLSNGNLYDDIIENNPVWYWENCHNEALFNLFNYSLSNVGSIPDDDYSANIAFAQDVNTFYCDYINDKWSDHVFYVLYSNKDFLFRFCSEVSRIVHELKATDYPSYLKSDGIIKRTKFPKWVKSVVRDRDRNHCQICGKDIFNELHHLKENYDHIIPLKLGGTNDATNIQLTCERCNKQKGARNADYNNIIIPFW